MCDKLVGETQQLTINTSFEDEDNEFVRVINSDQDELTQSITPLSI